MCADLLKPPVREPRILATLFYASLIVIPWVWAILMPVVFLIACYVGTGETGMRGALTDTAAFLQLRLGTIEVAAVSYILLGNLVTFGILIVICWLFTYIWNAKRVYCVLVVGILVPTVVAWLSQYGPTVTNMTQMIAFKQASAAANAELGDRAEPFLAAILGDPAEGRLRSTFGARSAWYDFVWSYPPIALLAIPIGALIAMHPIFKPGARYWLARGMCPKCQYDLRGSPGTSGGIEAGCPECGWNRPATSSTGKRSAS